MAIDRDWVKDAVRLIEASFIPSVVDRMIRAPDAASIAAIHWLETVIGRKCGGSTGTNVYGALTLAEEMIAEGARARSSPSSAIQGSAILARTMTRTGSRARVSIPGPTGPARALRDISGRAL